MWVLDGLLEWSAIIVAWIAGGISLWIVVIKRKETRKRDKKQIRRDEAHIANEIYGHIKRENKTEENKKVEAEVELYKKILDEIKSKLDIEK